MRGLSLKLKPLKGRGQWTATFDSGIVALQDPAQRQVLTVPQDDVAQYVRFQFDLFRGWTVTFSVIEGLKSYTFYCPRDDLSAALSYMPHRPPAEVAKEVRLTAVAVALFGVPYLVLPAPLSWWWGALLLGIGLVAFAMADRRVYGFNGALLFAVGVAQLVVAGPTTTHATDGIDMLPIFSTVMGVVLICWSVHQFSLIGPNARIRVARVRGARRALWTRPSKLVRAVAVSSLAGAVLLLAYAFVVAGLCWTGALPLSPTGPEAGFSLDFAGTRLPLLDVLACAALGLLSLVSALLLLTRGRSSYVEAKLIAQMLIALALLCVWGAAFGLFWDAPMPACCLLSNGLLSFASARPYAWLLTYIVLVMAFNRWFGRQVDRELERDVD